MSLSVQFHRSQWPDVVAAQLQASLRQGIVPGRFLYDSPAQSARWLAYHEGWSPARTEAAVQAQYDAAFDAALAEVGDDQLQYVSLGCGGGQKDARWIRRAGDREQRIILTDTSPALVITADRAVTEAGAQDVTRIVLDLATWPDRPAFAVDDGLPVVWSCLGILPNFEHERLLPYLARLVGPRDRLVLSANLSPAPFSQAESRIVPQYDNPLARAWYDGALVELGVPLSTTDRALVAAPVDDDEQTWRMRYLATAQAKTTVDVHGTAVILSPGRTLQVFQSTRYTPERLSELCRAADLTQCVAHVDPQREEGVYVLKRA